MATADSGISNAQQRKSAVRMQKSLDFTDFFGSARFLLLLLPPKRLFFFLLFPVRDLLFTSNISNRENVAGKKSNREEQKSLVKPDFLENVNIEIIFSFVAEKGFSLLEWGPYDVGKVIFLGESLWAKEIQRYINELMWAPVAAASFVTNTQWATAKGACFGT